LRIAIACAVAILLAAGAAILRVSLKIRRRARGILAVARAADRGADRVFEETRMRHRGSSFADGIPVPDDIAPAEIVPVFATAAALFIGPLAIPFSSVEDAALVEARLRIRWRCEGERIETWLEARRDDSERLRREIHLRQPHVAEQLVSMLGPKP